jgi:BON domain-containing protein
VKVYLIAPKNPESFWTFDRVLPSLGKRCVFPNLTLPTVAGLTPPAHAIVLCDENVEAIDFDTDADVVGITGFAVHKRRMFELAEAFTAKVKAAIFNDSTLKVNEIYDETFTGVVQLSGFARSQADIDQAAQGARGVAGVNSVTHDMRIE